jgi:hypothetical protein
MSIPGASALLPLLGLPPLSLFLSTRSSLLISGKLDERLIDVGCWYGAWQEEDSEEYGSPMVGATAIADLIKQRTELLLRKIQAAVSSKPIVMRAEYAHCPNLTIIDTPGFVLKVQRGEFGTSSRLSDGVGQLSDGIVLLLQAKRGEPVNTPDEIKSMVKALASPPHRLVLFLQQSSVEWCSSIWLDTLREIDPTFRRTMIVISKFDNRLKVCPQNCQQFGTQGLIVFSLNKLSHHYYAL